MPSPRTRVLRQVVTALDAGRPVAATADELGLGARQLHRRSLAAFGYGPKTLARVLRLHRALALARDGVPFADTAARAGYADQAHLARDVRELAGLPLGELLGRRPLAARTGPPRCRPGRGRRRTAGPRRRPTA